MTPDMEYRWAAAQDAIAELEASELELQRRILLLQLALCSAMPVLERSRDRHAPTVCRLIHNAFPDLRLKPPPRSRPTLIFSNTKQN